MPLIECAGLRIDVLGYQYPEHNDCYWDGNWLEVDFICEQPGRRSQFRDHCLRTDELKRFSVQLAAFVEKQADEAQIDTMEPYLKWRITRHPRLLSLVEDGHDRLSPAKFAFELKDEDVPPLKAQIDAVLCHFPIRGEGHDH